MININKLTKKDIGRWVSYGRSHMQDDLGIKIGRIKSWDDKYIFVVYECRGGEWDRFKDFTAVATRPESLTFISKEELELIDKGVL